MQKIPDADTTRTNILELGKVFRELSLQQNQEGKALNFRDLISRSLDDRSGMPPTGEGVRREFTLRPTGPEDMVVKTLLDRLHQTRDGESAAREFQIRTDMLTNRLDPKQLDGKMEIRPEKLDGIKLDAALRPEMLVRPEDLIRNQKELGAELEPGTKTDAVTQLAGRRGARDRSDRIGGAE